MLDEEKKVIKVRCRCCECITNHEIINVVRNIVNFDEPHMEDEWEDVTYLTAQCSGCEAVCLVIKSSFSWQNDDEGRPEVSTSVFPDPNKSREKINDSHFLPRSVNKIYMETIGAMNNDLPILTSIGLRTTVEAICLDQKITTGRLDKKIRELQTRGFITKQEADLLQHNRYMGNASAHELRIPDNEEIAIGIDIIEAALRNAYILPQKALYIKKLTEFKHPKKESSIPSQR